jgi:hypothetical protein
MVPERGGGARGDGARGDHLNMIYRSNFLVIRGLGLGLVFIKCGMIILVYIYYESTCVPRKVEKSPWTRRGRVDESS